MLADYLVQQAESSSELSPAQLAELDRRYADAVAHAEELLPPDEAIRRLKIESGSTDSDLLTRRGIGVNARGDKPGVGWWWGRTGFHGGEGFDHD